MQKITFEIIEQTDFDASDLWQQDQALISLGGCSDNGNKFGLGAWQMDFTVMITNRYGKTREFMVVFQPKERSNSMRNYSGYEVCPAAFYGSDYDESDNLLEFCGNETVVLDALHSIATNYAKTELKRLLAECE